MTRVRFRRPSPALAVAVLALFVAMGGVGIAEEAVTSAVDRINGKRLKNKSVPGKKLKNKTITGRKVRPGTLKAAHFGVGELPTLVDAYSKAESDGKYQPKGNYQPAGDYLAANGKAADADKLDGKDSGEFLGAGAKAADSELLDGKDSAEFLGAGAKAADAELLDGKDSADFLGKTEKAADSDKLDNIDSGGFMHGQAARGFVTVNDDAVGQTLLELSKGTTVTGSCPGGVPTVSFAPPASGDDFDTAFYVTIGTASANVDEDADFVNKDVGLSSNGGELTAYLLEEGTLGATQVTQANIIGEGNGPACTFGALAFNQGSAFDLVFVPFP